ncbi:MAG: PQQ-binding-like beta-propeller repeat protein [Phycisphaerales bacterium]|nr:MAG: PQQ-binding-like beta-propeller repeat protein [Phycisphaerales bacterium]
MNHSDSFVFVGLNSRVAALDRDTGQTQWQWRAPKPHSGGYVSLLPLDGQHLIVSVNGYTYCLDPRTGAQVWANDLPGFGSQVASLAAASAHTPPQPSLGAVATDAAAASATIV